MQNKMLIHFMPSEIARLVLGYIKEVGCLNTIGVFLAECKHLTEYLDCLQNGYEYPTSIGGKSLKEILQDYCRLKSAEGESLPVDNCAPLVQQLKVLLPQLEELLPQLRQVLASGVRSRHATPFTSISHHAVLQKTRTRCAVVEAQRHNTGIVQQCPSQDDTSNTDIGTADSVSNDTGIAINDTTSPNTVVAITDVIPDVDSANTRIDVIDAVTIGTDDITSSVSTGNAVVTDAGRPTSNTTHAGVVRFTTNTTVAATITGTTTTPTITTAGSSTGIITGSYIRNDATSRSNPAPVASLQDCNKCKLTSTSVITPEDSLPTVGDQDMVDNTNELLVTSAAPKTSCDSLIAEEIVDGADVWTSTQPEMAETTVPLEVRLLIDQACSPIVIEDSVVEDSHPSLSMEVDQPHQPLCTPVKFGIFSEDSNFRSPRRKCQLPKRRNAQTPGQSARKRNQVSQDEDSTTSLDCQSEESIGFSGLLDQLINNKALHEKLAENINKVVSTSVPVEPEEIIVETPLKAVPATLQIMPPPSSPTGSVLDTPSKELFVPESLIKDIVNRTESDPMFEELLTSFFDNIKIDSNTSSLDSTFPETLPLSCASTSNEVQLQTSQHQSSTQDSMSNDVSTMLNSVLSDAHTLPDGPKTDKHVCSPTSMFSFPHTIQSATVVNSMENLNTEVSVNNALVPNNLHSEAVKPCDTTNQVSSKDSHNTSPLQRIEVVQNWTENLTETADVLSTMITVPVSHVDSPTNNANLSNQNESRACPSSTTADQELKNASPVSVCLSNINSNFSNVKCSDKVVSQCHFQQSVSKTRSNQDTSTNAISTVANNFVSEKTVQQKFACIEPSPATETHNEPDFLSLELATAKELGSVDVTDGPQLPEPTNTDNAQSLLTPYKSSRENESLSTKSISSSTSSKEHNQDTAPQQIHLVVTKTTPAKITMAKKNVVKKNADVPLKKKQATTPTDIPTYGMRSLMPICLPPVSTTSHSGIPQVVVMPQDWNNSLGNANTRLMQTSDSGIGLASPRIGVMGDQPLLIQQPGGGVATLLLPASPNCGTNQVLMTIPGKDGMSTVELISIPPDGCSSAADSSTKFVPGPKLMPASGLKAPFNVRRNLKVLPRRVSKQAKEKLKPKEKKRIEAFPGYCISSEVIARPLYLPRDSPLPQAQPVLLSATPSKGILRKATTVPSTHITKSTMRTTTTTAIITSASATTTASSGSHSLISATTAANFVTHTTSEISTKSQISGSDANSNSLLQKECSKATKILPSTPAPVSVLPKPVPSVIENAVSAAADTPNTMSTFQSTTSCTVSIIKSMPTFKTNVRDTSDVSYLSVTRSVNQARTTPGRRQNQSRSPQLKSLVNSVRRATSIKPRGNHIRVLDFSTPPKNNSGLHFTPKKQAGLQQIALSPKTNNFSFFSNITKTLSRQNKLSQVSVKDKLKANMKQITEMKSLPVRLKEDSAIKSKQCSTSSVVESRPSTSTKPDTVISSSMHSPTSKSKVGSIANQQSANSKQSTVASSIRTSKKTKRKQRDDDDQPTKKTKRDKANVLTAMDVENFLAKLHYVE